MLGNGEVKDNSTWYQFSDMSIEIIYSDGSCTEGWLAPNDTVIQTSANFFDHKELSQLTSHVNFAKMRRQEAFDISGERFYLDDKNGIGYGINEKQNTWFKISFYPSEKHAAARCEPHSGLLVKK